MEAKAGERAMHSTTTMAIPRTFASLSLVLLLVVSPLCCMARSILYSGESLKAGEFLNYESFRFIMQNDCNLVLYDNDRPVWASGTYGGGNLCYVTLQSDGNLVIFNRRNIAVWASNSNFLQNHYVLVLQKNRNVVIYGPAWWATHTVTGVSAGGMFIESKATIFGALPANETTAEAMPARVSMVVNK